MSLTVIPLTELRKNALLPAAIFDGQNESVLLLNRGIRLTGENLLTLQRRGIKQVAIDSRHAGAIRGGTARTRTVHKPSEVPAERQKLSTRLQRPKTPQFDKQLVSRLLEKQEEHERGLHMFINSIGENRTVRGDTIKRMATESIEHMLEDIDLFVKTTIEGEHDGELSKHCLRVAKLAMSMATILEHKEDEVRQIGLGCMLCRVGIDHRTMELMNQNRPLTALELLELRKHPGRTWDTLERISDLPVGARQVAWQINERWNGTGYPRGRSEKQIHTLARIAMVADVYIALTSDRPHRQAYSPHESLKTIIRATEAGQFEPRAVRGLLRTVSLFPLGSCVELSNGTLALSLRNHPTQYDRPLVQIVCDLAGNRLPEHFIDLSETPDLRIIASHPQEFLDQCLSQSESSNEELDDFFAAATAAFSR
ncbi:MAG: hypothetical protein CMJ47_10690 [Planctomyces sp.]|nr:hypothetical protein [Planctomyces sp.]